MFCLPVRYGHKFRHGGAPHQSRLHPLHLHLVSTQDNMHPRELEAWLVRSLAWFCVWVVVRGLIGAGGCNLSRSASAAWLLALCAPRLDIT